MTKPVRHLNSLHLLHESHYQLRLLADELGLRRAALVEELLRERWEQVFPGLGVGGAFEARATRFQAEDG